MGSTEPGNATSAAFCARDECHWSLADGERVLTGILGDIASVLPDLMDVGVLPVLFQFLPWMLYFIVSPATDDGHAKSLLEGVHRLFDRAGDACIQAFEDGERCDVEHALSKGCFVAVDVMLSTEHHGTSFDKILLRRVLPVLRTIWMAAGAWQS